MRKTPKEVNYPSFNDITSEQAILSIILKNHAEVFYDIDSIISEGDFYHPENRIIYSVCKQLIDVKKVSSIELGLILQEINAIDKTLSDKYNLPEYLQHLYDKPIKKDNAEQYAKNIGRSSLVRTLDAQLTIAKDNLSTVSLDKSILDIAGETEKIIFDFSSKLLASEQETTNLADSLDSFVEQLLSNKRKSIGIKTGFPEYDKAIGGGIRAPGVAVIGARPKCVATHSTRILTNKGYHKYKTIEKDKDILILNRNNELQKPSRRFTTNKEKTLIITTSLGYSIECTPDHPLLSVNDYINAGELKLNHIVTLLCGSNCYGSSHKDIFSAYKLGRRDGNQEFMRSMFEHDQETICNYIAGLWDTSGIIDDSIYIKSKSEEFINSLQIALLNLGITSNVISKSNSKKRAKILNIENNKRNISTFKHKILLSCKDKRTALSKLYSSYDCKSEYVSKKPEYIHDRVVSIRKSCARTFDFTFDQEPSFITNGFISHNCGKTSAAINIAKNVGLNNIPVLYLDTEMTKELTLVKLISSLSQIDVNLVETGRFADNASYLQQVQDGVKKLKETNINYHNISGLKHAQVISLVRKWIHRVVGFDENGNTKPCLILLDYIKTMDTKEFGDLQEYQYLGQYLTDLHNFSIQYNIAILAFVQLNRDGINKTDTSVVAGSDRIIWLCTSFTVLSNKSPDDIVADPLTNGNKKLTILAQRFGPGIGDNEYINIKANLSQCYIEEGLSNLQTRQTRTLPPPTNNKPVSNQNTQQVPDDDDKIDF